MSFERIARLVPPFALAFALALAVGGPAASAHAGGKGGGRGGEHGGKGGGGERGDKGDKGDKGEKGEKGEGAHADDDEAGKPAGPTPAFTIDFGGLDGLRREDAEQARAAFGAGRIRPLAEILRVARRSVEGRVLDVHLRRGFFGTWTYEVTVLDRAGRYSDITIDAGAGKVTDVRRR